MSPGSKAASKKREMGTNFYTLNGTHVGKRSAAGRYCWGCRITLCTGAAHSGAPFHEACPRCGAEPEKEAIAESSAGRELGFNHSRPMAKSGVRTCSSFSWAIEPSALEGLGDIVDEYGGYYSRPEFREMLEECPIQSTAP